VIINDKAVFLIVPRYSRAFVGNLAELVSQEGEEPPLTGCVVCPKGCGTRVYWALSASVAEYQTQFLIFLNQQLSWTACPEHKKILPQQVVKPEHEEDWTSLPSASSILSGGLRYMNCYE